MKIRIGEYLRLLREGLGQTVRLRPLETGLIVICAVLSVWIREKGERLWFDQEGLAVFPLFVFVALVVNTLAGQTVWRRLYWVSWVPMIPLLFWSGLGDWIESVPCAITFGMLVPLAVLLCRRAVENRRFVDDAVIYVRSAVLAAIFANVALALFEAILWSTAYIFGFSGREWMENISLDVLILTETLAMPMLFLMMLDRWGGGTCRGSRMLEVLLNYIVTPALMIYAAILYLYMAKIVVLWSLPEGGVAYMVFAFALLTFVMRALQSLLDKRIGEWFYARFSYVLLPAVVLFWTGVARRIGEYGLTEARVFLVVCGAVMTLCLLLFLTRRTGRYFYVCLAAFVCFAALAYIPSLHPERIAVRSQLHRVERVAGDLGLLTSDGQLKLHGLSADTTLRRDYRRLYEALDYVSNQNEESLARFGFGDMDQFRNALPLNMYVYVVYGSEYDYRTGQDEDEAVEITATPGRAVHDFGKYSVLYTDVRSWFSSDAVNYAFSDDSLRINFGGVRPAFVIAGPELLKKQFDSAGIEDSVPNRKTLERVSDALLTYREDEIMVIFSDMQFRQQDSTLVLVDVTVDAVLTR